MAESTIVSTTKLRQAFPVTEPINTTTTTTESDLHNLQIKINRKRLTIRGTRHETEQVTSESEEVVDKYIPESIFNSVDNLCCEMNKILRERLELSLDDGTVNGVADVVYCNLRGTRVCNEGGGGDELVRTVVVVIVEIREVEELPDDEYQDSIWEMMMENGEVYVDDEDGDGEWEEGEGVEGRMERVEIKEDGSEEEEWRWCDSCAICWDGYVVGVEAVKLMPCNHVFHGECIRDWLERRRSCPLCRKRIRVD